MPSFGYCSTRKMSCHLFETALAIAQPITPPPMIRMLAWSMKSEYRKLREENSRSLARRIGRLKLLRPYFQQLPQLLIAAHRVKKGITPNQPRLRPIVNGIGSLFVRFIAIAPERSRAVHTVFVDGIKIDMKSSQLFLVVFVIVRDAAHGFQARVRR